MSALRTRRIIRALPILCLLTLTACAGANTALKPDNIRKTVAEDLRNAYAQDPSDEGVLTLEMAIARAIKYNLDAKVAETEAFVAGHDATLTGLEALPTASLNASRVGRNNKGGSSSRSLQTGIQSLEPSISTDQYRYTQQLKANWNALDAGLAISRARSATDRQRVAQERKRKVFGDVIAAVYNAYWRAAAAQRAAPVIAALRAEASLQAGRLDEAAKAGLLPLGDAKTLKATLLSKRAALTGLEEKLQLSELSLKTLIGLPPQAPLRLDVTGQDWLSARRLPRVSRDEETMRSIALMNRPEVRQELLNKVISARNVQMEIFSTFPGAEAMLTGNRDTNSFLANSTWIDWTLGLTQSITKILTLPARYRRAKSDQKLNDQRRLAQVAAVVTQVTVANVRYGFLQRAFDAASEVDENNRQLARRAEGFAKTGMMAGPQKTVAGIDAAVSGIDRMNAYADAQEGYSTLLFTLGIDLWDGDAKGMELPDIAAGVRRNLAALEEQVLNENDDKETQSRS